MAFNYAGSINGSGRRLRKYQCTASQDMLVGGAVGMGTTTGTVVAADAAEEIIGIIAGFVDKYGNAQPVTTVTAGTAAETTKTEDSSTATSDYVLVDVNPGSLYSCELDATVGTTTGSNKAGVWFTLANDEQLDESTVEEQIQVGASDTLVHAYSHGLDPKNSARVLCNFILAAGGPGAYGTKT